MVLDCASAKEGKTIVPAASANAPAIIISAVRIAFIGNLQQPHPRGNRDTQARQSHHVSAMIRAQTTRCEAPAQIWRNCERRLPPEGSLSLTRTVSSACVLILAKHDGRMSDYLDLTRTLVASDKMVGIGFGLRWPSVMRPGVEFGWARRVSSRPRSRSAAASVRPYPRSACNGAAIATRRWPPTARRRSVVRWTTRAGRCRPHPQQRLCRVERVVIGGPLSRILSMAHERKVAIVGLGYVGLPVAVAFARTGQPVIAFDIDRQRIEDLRDG